MNKVKARCPKCQLKYSIEPSFYSGAMYVSYGVGTGVAISVYVLTLLFELDLGPLGILLSIIIALILLMPYIGLFLNQFGPICFLSMMRQLLKILN